MGLDRVLQLCELRSSESDTRGNGGGVSELTSYKGRIGIGQARGDISGWRTLADIGGICHFPMLGRSPGSSWYRSPGAASRCSVLKLVGNGPGTCRAFIGDLDTNALDCVLGETD